MARAFSPGYRMTPAIVGLVADIGIEVGRHSALADTSVALRLRKQNRIRTIHASLAIENNSLTLDQVTAVINGKRVLGHPREIQEVHNALAAYDAMDGWDPRSSKDLLVAHGLLMAGLVDEPGKFRNGGVGVFAGTELVHMAPPAGRVPGLVDGLLTWLGNTREHPLVAGSLFHYELEFIHPFADGNGRMGRLWQTLILSRWQPIMGWLPVETVIKERQAGYYDALSASGKSGDSTVFVEFMLQAILESLREADPTQEYFLTEAGRRLADIL